MEPLPRIGDPDAMKRALELLRSGGVVILPTDTLYGFHARAGDADAVARIRALKGRGADRGFVVLASSMDMVEGLVLGFGCSSREALEKLWPAPLTVVLPAGPRRPDWMGDTVAVRIPALPALRALVARLGEAVVSTSVNRAGEAPIGDPQRIRDAFDVDFVVAGETTPAGASTVVDLTGNAPRVLRRGDYDWAAATGDSNPSK